MEFRYKVLVIDDQHDHREQMLHILAREGFDTVGAVSGHEGVEKAQTTHSDIIIMDIAMSEMDGVETCMQIRALQDSKHPIIVFLSSRNEDYSQIAALEAGGDDYVTRPIKPRVFVSRLKALIRRSQLWQKVSIENGNGHAPSTILNKERYSVLHNGTEYELPRKEFGLLSLLMSKPGKVFTRESILNAVWDEEDLISDRTIDVHIRRLRTKLGKERIKTLKGIGYKYCLTIAE
ncbi:MAG: response regulator transcription factor [Flavobacteriales bacterium]|nr:response regulator transcription factor [Flavobacteriales bacterium]